jgi:hypothetical protein
MNLPEDDSVRAQPFRRNRSLESLLSSLNNSLSSAEHEALGNYSAGHADHPVVFVMGPHRGGTTLFMQWLAKNGVVAYPTNLLSRFYGAPVTGAQIQLLLTDPQFNFRNEILDFNSEITFESENGKTTGALAPNEFWYFWRRFLPFQDLDWLPDEELFRVVDQKMLVNELVTLTRVFGKPFALKSMILNYNIPFLDAIFKKAFFIQIKRNPITNVASILEARKRQLGDENKWYSFKIPEYPKLKDRDAITQSAGQVHYINRAITRGMESVDAPRRLVVQYEDFCEDPHQVHEHLLEKLNIDKSDSVYTGPEHFKVTRTTCPTNAAKIEKALSEFSCH